MADIAIIGAGHNGLVCACYLAKAGHKVTIFERRPVVGGCCVTEEIFPGFKVSTLAYLNSLFSEDIVRDLNLKHYGYEIIDRNPFSFTPMPQEKITGTDRDYLLLGLDPQQNYQEISKFSQHDADNYALYEQALDKIVQFIKPLMDNPTPQGLMSWLSLLYGARKLNFDGALNFARLMGFPAFDYLSALKFLNRWFESDVLKATLLTDAAIGATNFSGYVLLHHMMGEANGTRGMWGYQKGGMGGLTQALARAAEDLGVKIHTNTGVKKIIVESERVHGLILENGEFILADCIVSNATPDITFDKLIDEDVLPYDFKYAIDRIDYASATMKVNLALKGLPNFYCKPHTGDEPQDHHIGTTHISPSVDYILKGARDSWNGYPSYSPLLELTIPSVLDDSLAPSGHHIMGIFVQFTPYQLLHSHESWDSYKYRYYESHILRTLRQFISNIDDIIMDYQIISPLDLEQEYSLTGGNIFHGAMTLSQLFHKRPILGYSDYRTPISGLYSCSSSTHEGGGVTGGPGKKSAKIIGLDLAA